MNAHARMVAMDIAFLPAVHQSMAGIMRRQPNLRQLCHKLNAPANACRSMLQTRRAMPATGDRTPLASSATRQHAGWASTEGHAGQAPMLRARHARASRC